MIDPIAKACGIRLMLSLSSCVFGHMDFREMFPVQHGNVTSLLRDPMLNRFSTLSMYVDCERPSNPFGSISIDPYS